MHLWSGCAVLPAPYTSNNISIIIDIYEIKTWRDDEGDARAQAKEWLTANHPDIPVMDTVIKLDKL